MMSDYAAMLPSEWSSLAHGETQDYRSRAHLGFANIFHLGSRPTEPPWNSVMAAATVTEILGKILVPKSSGLPYVRMASRGATSVMKS